MLCYTALHVSARLCRRTAYLCSSKAVPRVSVAHTWHSRDCGKAEADIHVRIQPPHLLPVLRHCDSHCTVWLTCMSHSYGP